MKNYWIANKRSQTKVSRKDQVVTEKEGKRQQFLYGGVHRTPCDRPVIFRRCDHNGLKKELCEIGEEAIWESRFTSFFISISILVETTKKKVRAQGAFHESSYVLFSAISQVARLIRWLSLRCLFADIFQRFSWI